MGGQGGLMAGSGPARKDKGGGYWEFIIAGGLVVVCLGLMYWAGSFGKADPGNPEPSVLLSDHSVHFSAAGDQESAKHNTFESFQDSYPAAAAAAAHAQAVQPEPAKEVGMHNAHIGGGALSDHERGVIEMHIAARKRLKEGKEGPRSVRIASSIMDEHRQMTSGEGYSRRHNRVLPRSAYSQVPGIKHLQTRVNLRSAVREEVPEKAIEQDAMASDSSAFWGSQPHSFYDEGAAEAHGQGGYEAAKSVPPDETSLSQVASWGKQEPTAKPLDACEAVSKALAATRSENVVPSYDKAFATFRKLITCNIGFAFLRVGRESAFIEGKPYLPVHLPDRLAEPMLPHDLAYQALRKDLFKALKTRFTKRALYGVDAPPCAEGLTDSSHPGGGSLPDMLYANSVLRRVPSEQLSYSSLLSHRHFAEAEALLIDMMANKEIFPRKVVVATWENSLNVEWSFVLSQGGGRLLEVDNLALTKYHTKKPVVMQKLAAQLKAEKNPAVLLVNLGALGPVVIAELAAKMGKHTYIDVDGLLGDKKKERAARGDAFYSGEAFDLALGSDRASQARCKITSYTRIGDCLGLPGDEKEHLSPLCYPPGETEPVAPKVIGFNDNSGVLAAHFAAQEGQWMDKYTYKNQMVTDGANARLSLAARAKVFERQYEHDPLMARAMARRESFTERKVGRRGGPKAYNLGHSDDWDGHHSHRFETQRDASLDEYRQDPVALVARNKAEREAAEAGDLSAEEVDTDDAVEIDRSGAVPRIDYSRRHDVPITHDINEDASHEAAANERSEARRARWEGRITRARGGRRAGGGAPKMKMFGGPKYAAKMRAEQEEEHDSGPAPHQEEFEHEEGGSLAAEDVDGGERRR